MKKKDKKKYASLINKSVGAAFLISLGNFALLKLGNPIGPVIFAFGLLGVCYLGQNLFTGKCGFLIADKIKPLDLTIILVVNMISGYLIGLLYSATDSSLVPVAAEKIATWDFSFAYFSKSLLCGAIMYLAVKMYKNGTPLGIIFGVPLFIFCGFQHCVANIATLGIAGTFSFTILVCIAGNFFGSLITWYFTKD
jgi:formate/nitrite transporter FocA (FNT family)